MHPRYEDFLRMVHETMATGENTLASLRRVCGSLRNDIATCWRCGSCKFPSFWHGVWSGYHCRRGLPRAPASTSDGVVGALVFFYAGSPKSNSRLSDAIEDS